MDLFIMRHGIAEDEAATGRDRDRLLTSRGRAQVQAVARALRARGEVPVRVLSSPFVRARETAEAFVQAVTPDLEVEFCRELASGADAGGLFASAGPLAPDVLANADAPSPVIVVGHEPDLSALVLHLSGVRPMKAFDKAMVVALTTALDTGDAAAWPRVSDRLFQVRFVFDPKSLEASG